MNLSEPTFLLFLGAVLAVCWVFVRVRGAVPPAAILLASAVFYGSWNPAYLLPLAATILVDFGAGRALGRLRALMARRALLGAVLLAHLALLGVFKYWDVTAQMWTALFGPTASPAFRVVLVIGLSFYSLQGLSYVLDVYRGDVEPVSSVVKFAAFVAFFPTMLAGPITRADTLLPQLARPIRPMQPELAGQAFFLIAFGFIKKCAIADYLGDQVVNRVFEQPLLFSSVEVLTGVYAYAAQIYCDFSGYSDIAIGAALLFGFKLKDNFRSPYRASSLGEFWQRWHISFSSWLRDYIFFSVPGVRRRPMAMLAILVTFLIGGLWHNASWCFLIWGAIHGISLAFERLIERPVVGRRPPKPWWRRVVGGFVTFHVVLIAWVFFRAESLTEVGQIAQRLGDLTTGAANVVPMVVVAIVASIVPQWLPERWLDRLRTRFVALPAWQQGALLLVIAAGVRLASSSKLSQFIYQGY